MTTRRERDAASTRLALVQAAEWLFTEHGYATTSLDAIAAAADVTKGALYHHFSGKQAVFEAAVARVEQDATAGIAQATEGHQDPWDRARAGLRAFLAAVQQPAYRQIVIADGPSVLGRERFREQEERSTYAIVDDIVRSVLTSEQDLDEDMLDTFTRIFFGALSAAGGSVALSADPAAAAARVESAIELIMTGLRHSAEGGA